MYWTDTGVLAHLLASGDADLAAKGPLAGPLVETAVLDEITRTLAHRGERPRISFWRTSTGDEVDFLVQCADGLIAIEVKASATPNARMATGLRKLRDVLGDRITRAFVIHPGSVRVPLGDGIVALPFCDL